MNRSTGLSVSLLVVCAVSACSFDLSVPDNTARGALTGTVDTANRAPREGITVRLTEVRGSKSTQDTDAAGKFTFADLAPGTYFLEIQREGFAPFSLPALQVKKGETVDVGVLKLLWLQGTPAEATLTGKVVTQGGGVPDSARVDFLLQSSMQRIATTVVDSAGLFTQRLPPGRYLLRASHPLYVTAERRDVVVAEGAQVDLSQDPLSLALNPASLTGRVLVEVDGSNAPTPKAQVQVTLDSGQTTTTDVDGRFMLSGLAGGARQVRFAVAGYVDTASGRAITLSPGQAATLPDVTLSLRRGAIRGTVQLSDRQPVQDVTVSVTGTPYATLVTPDATQPGVGTFRLSGVPLGTYEVSATKARYARAVAGAVQLTEAAPIADVGALTLTLLQGEFRIDDADPLSSPGFTRTRGVSLDLSQFTGATEFRASEDPQFADGGAPWTAFSSSTQPFTLGQQQGTHTVYAQYRTTQGTSPTFSSTVVLDTDAPTSANLVLNGGEAFTRLAQTLAVRLTADDPVPALVDRAAGLARMRVSLTGPADGGMALVQAPVDYLRDHALSLPQPQADGPITVWAQVLDAAGNASAIVSAQIVIDRVEPQSPQVSIRDGDAATAPGFTNVGQVVVNHAAAPEPSGGALFVKLANSAPALANAVYQPLSPATVHALDPTGADLKTVHVRLRDSAGNETAPLTAQIVYDVTPPGPLSVTLLSATPTNDAGVTLRVTATDTNGLSPTRGVAVSEDPLFSRDVLGPQALPTDGRLTYTLSAGDGAKQVLVRVTDKAGNAASASVAVTLDTTPPSGSFVVTGTLADGSPSTQDTSTAAVRVAVTAPDAVQVLLGDETLSPCPTAGYQAWQPSLAHTLTGATAPRTVRVCVRDATGNTAALPEQRIRLDATAPTGCALTLTGKRANDAAAPPAGKTAKELVTAAVACSGETPTELVLTNGAVTCSATAQLDWRAYTPTAAFLLAGPDGANPVNGCVRDAARNVAAVTGATITLDTTPPQGAALLLDPAGGVSARFVNQAQITSRGGTKANAQGQAAGAVEWILSQSADFSGASWAAFPGTSPQLFTFAGAGVQTLYAQFRDDVGNVSPAALASITFDDTPPANGTLAITTPGGGSVTNSVSVVVTVGAPADAVSLQLAEGAGSCSASTFSGVTPRPVTGSVTFVLSAGDGAKTVCAQFIDAAGNVSTTPASASVTLDTAPPTVAVDLTVSSVTNPAATRVPGVSVTLTAAGATQYALSSAPQECGALPTTAWQTLTASPIAFTLPGTGSPPSTQTVFACVRDTAGNTASAARSILFDTVAPSGSFTIGSGAAVQTGASFTLSFRDVPADVTQMALAIDAVPTCATASYGTFVASSSQTLTDGSHDVRACLRDAAGNTALLGPVNVTVDNAPPSLSGVTLSGLSNQAAGVTRLFGVTVQLAGITDFTSGVVSLRISADPSFSGASFEPASGGAVVTGSLSRAFTLPPGDGPKTVYAQVQDRAGLVSSPVNVGVVLDTTAPVFGQDPAPVSLYVGTATGSIALSASDAIDASAQLSVGFAVTASGCAAATLQPFAATVATSALVAGWNTLFVCLRDRAGNSPPLPPSTQLYRIATAPSAAALVPNSPIALASGALLSWTDTNPWTQLVEVDASLDPTFATGVRRYAAATGTCPSPGATRVAPPSSARIGLAPGDLPLTNLRNWYFRMRAVDCAGAATPDVAVSGLLVPNFGETPLGEDLINPALDAQGADLWAHAPEAGAIGRAERLRHCKAGAADCRNAASWSSVRVPLYPNALAGSELRPARLLATDDTVYLVDTLEYPIGTWRVVMSWCDRRGSCDLPTDWTTGITLRAGPASGIMSAPAVAMNAHALAVFYVLRQPAYGNQSLVSVTRCDRGRGTGCRTDLSWSQVDSAVVIDEAKPLTATGSDALFLLGAVSKGALGATVTGSGQPMLLRCENDCAVGGTPAATTCTGNNCGCDGYVCGALRFSRFTQAAVGEQMTSLAPTIVSAAGQRTAAWIERRCPTGPGPCTESIRTTACLSADCFYGTNYLSPATTATWSAPNGVTLTSPLRDISLVSSGTQEALTQVRLTYTDRAGNAWLVGCSTTPVAACFTSSFSTQLAGSDRTVTSAVASVGRDLYALGTAATGAAAMYQPVVSAPREFVWGPKVDSLTGSWTASSAASGAQVQHELPDGGSPVVVNLFDTFVDTLALPTAQTRRATLRFFNSSGVGEPGAQWTSSPFKQTLGPAGDLAGTKGMSVAAPGAAPSPFTTNPFVYGSFISAARGVGLSRCNSAAGCSASGDWTHTTVDGTAGFDSLQVAAEYPREYAHVFGNYANVSSSTARLFVSGVQGGQLWMHGCLLNNPASSCAAAGDFAKFRIDAPPNLPMQPSAVPMLRATGDYVQVTENGGGGTVIVRFCDGSHTYPHNPYDGTAGVGTTDRPLDYCFTSGTWRSVQLNGSLYGSSLSSTVRVVGMPHPVHGWMAVQPRDPTGFVFWTCQYAQAGSAAAAQVDCGLPANWKAAVVDTGGPVDFPDLTATGGSHYFPTRLISEWSIGVYVSYFDATLARWGISQCKGDVRPDFLGWACPVETGAAHIARSWASATILPNVPGTPAGGTLRIIGGDLLASFNMTGRAYLARCSGGIDCLWRSAWSVHSVGVLTTAPRGLGHLAGGSTGDLFLATEATGNTPAMLSGGRLVTEQ